MNDFYLNLNIATKLKFPKFQLLYYFIHLNCHKNKKIKVNKIFFSSNFNPEKLNDIYYLL